MTCGGRPEITQVGFDHTEANSMMTLFTRRMPNSGFLVSSAFNPTWAHQTRHVDAYIQVAESVFQGSKKSQKLSKKMTLNRESITNQNIPASQGLWNEIFC